MRQIVLDTETTGIQPEEGHRIIEIGCVELINRKLTGNTFHKYINPDRLVDEEAIKIHGITNEFLEDKPKFNTKEVVDDFIDFISGAELIIHNAAFDVGFMDHEFRLCGRSLPLTADICTVLDTLEMARKKRPGQKNSLDALCKAYHVKNDHRTYHGALLDSQILADVYLAMTGGQGSLLLDANDAELSKGINKSLQSLKLLPETKVLYANAEELDKHNLYLKHLEEKSGKPPIFNQH